MGCQAVPDLRTRVTRKVLRLLLELTIVIIITVYEKKLQCLKHTQGGKIRQDKARQDVLH